MGDILVIECYVKKQGKRMKKSMLSLIAALLFVFQVGGTLAAEDGYKRSVENLDLPNLVLVDQDGRKVPIKSLLEADEPVVVDFIYATCTTICPILSAGFANLQKRLGGGGNEMRLVSISIDPENDTPGVMKEYLERYDAQPGWTFLSGTRQDINLVMEAFDAYFPTKMSHLPLYFIRSGEKGKWVRIEGLVSGRDLLNEIEKERVL